MEQFDIIMFKGESIFGKLIRYFTNSDYSHVAMFVDDIHIVESDIFVPVSIRHTKYASSRCDIYRIKEELTVEQKIKIKKFIMNELNKNYDYKFVVSRWFNLLFGTKVYSSDVLYNCDELIYEVFLSVNIQLIEDKLKLSPQKLSESKLLYKVN